MVRKLLVLVLAAGVMACAAAEQAEQAAESDAATGAVAVEGGLVAGVPAGGDGSVRMFGSIPYAAPPLGERRWLPPQPIEAWDGVRDGSALPPACIQPSLPVPPGEEPFFGAGSTRMEEDCLYLNVWSAAAAGDAAPVLVWIHGGGLFVGDGSMVANDGTALASRGVVVVTINYRLGALGYLTHALLREESGHSASGNYGLLDQVAALQWVQRNIEAFGGDPGRVTIFGESAGSWSVNYLMATPLASGLFAGAIGQSGGAFAPAAVIKGVRVERLAGPGVEVIVGVSRDPDFGPMLAVGLGGVLVEVLDDMVLSPAPVDAAEAREMLRRLRGRRILDGVRGAPPADVDALVALLVSVSEFAASAGDALEALDLNPVIVHPRGRGITVADAGIVTGAACRTGQPGRR